ncbi:MAG TPA: DHHW family protein [Clostridia bacterium]|nr:DHHW family protein [Clostridia bacterium]
MGTRKISVLYIVTRVMLAILIMFSVTILVRFFTRQVLIEKMGMNNRFTRAVFFDALRMEENVQSPQIDWSGEFPFDEVGSPVEARSNQSISIISQHIASLVKSLESRIVSYTTDTVIFYPRILEMANQYKKAIGWNMVPNAEYNGVISMDDGYLTTIVEKRDISDNVKAISDLKTYLDKQGIDLLYVQIPHKICKHDTKLSGVIDFSNQNADAFLSGLKEQRVDYLDLRNVLHKEGLNHHELFYRTDHHWKAETGLWAAGIVSKTLNDRYGFNIDLESLNPENFEYKVYEKWFFGSQGKKVTLSRAQPEDIALIYPREEAMLSFRVPGNNLDLSGSFGIFYDESKITEIDYYNNNPYAAYMYADNAYSLVANHRVAENNKVLVIGDSNDNSMIPFLALGIRNVDSLDLRHFNGSLRNLILKEKYDLVIINYVSDYIKAIDYSTHNSTFDFR